MRTKQPEATSGSFAWGHPPTYALPCFSIHDMHVLNSYQIQKLLCLMDGTPSVMKEGHSQPGWHVGCGAHRLFLANSNSLLGLRTKDQLPAGNPMPSPLHLSLRSSGVVNRQPPRDLNFP